MEIKEFKKLEELKLNENDIILLDNYEDKKYIDSIGKKNININELHKDLKIELKYIDEVEKLIFISKTLDKEIDDSVIEIGNFLTEFKIYNLEEKLELKKHITHKNLEKIKELYKQYNLFKKENCFYDATDGIDFLLQQYEESFDNIYLYNLNYIDEKRTELIKKIINQSNKTYILKEKGKGLSFFENSLQQRKHKDKPLMAKHKTLDTKMSIMNFLSMYKKENIDKNMGIILMDQNNFLNFDSNIKNKDVNFILSLFKIKENKYDLYDVDNILIFLNESELRKELLKFSKKNILFKDKKELKEVLNNDSFNSLIDLTEKSPSFIFNKIFMDYNISFIPEIERYLKYVDNSNLSQSIKNIIILYTTKKSKQETVFGYDVIPFSKIHTKDTVFVLYGGIKSKKDSFLSDFHRKELGLVYSDLYMELQKEYIKNLAEFENIVFLDYKFNVNEVNEEQIFLELEKFEAKIKPIIDDHVIVNHEIDYNSILKEKDLEIDINDMHKIIEDKKIIIEKYLLLKGDYLLNLSEEGIKKFILNILYSYFKDKESFDNIKSGNWRKDNKLLLKIDEILKSNYSVKLKSKVLFFKNRIIQYLELEEKNFSMIKNIENNVKLSIDYNIEELGNKIVGININIDRIDWYEDNSVDIIFYTKEPFTWSNKYHKTSMLKKLLKLYGYQVRDIKYFGLLN